MLGFFAGLYVAGGVWYYKQLDHCSSAEKATVVVWPVITAFGLVLSGLDYSARIALRKLEENDA